MAIDVKGILADTLLELCKEKDFKSITVKDIRDRSGVSKTGFYNHFRDKNDLAQWIYYHRIQTSFQKENFKPEGNYYNALLDYYKRVEKYHLMDELAFFTEYHSSGAVSMTIKWIQNDMPFPPEEMARRIVYLKRGGFARILNDAEENSKHPYE